MLRFLKYSAFVLTAIGTTLLLLYIVGVETTSVVTNVFLTTVLIIVYREISKDQEDQTDETARQADLQKEVVNIQRRQADISERQQELSVIEQRPVLQVEGYRPADAEYSRYSSSALEVKVSNIGRTPAMDLKVEFVTGFADTLPLSSGQNLISVRRKEEDDNWYHEWGENLENGKNDVIYVGEPLMIVWHNIDTDNTKQRALEFVKNRDEEFENVDEIRLKATLVYDGVDQSYAEPVFDYLVPLESYGGMRSALEHGRPYNESMGMSISEKIYEFEI